MLSPMDTDKRVQLTVRRESKPQISSFGKNGDEPYEKNNVLTKFSSSTNSVTDQSGDCEKRNIRNSALKIFGRYRRKKSSSSGNSQISDVNDSARRDISSRSNNSSSPVERNNSLPCQPFDNRTLRSFTTEQGTVTVLKPVSEFADPFRASYKIQRDSTQSGSSLEPESTKQSKTLTYIETSSPCKYENKADPQLKNPKETETHLTLNETHKAEVQNENWARQDSPATESLRSGSSFSRISNSTSSRACQSEISTSRGTSPDLYPPRKSSKYYHPYSNGRLVNIERNPDSLDEIRASTPSRRRVESLTTSPYVFGTGTAKLARSYSGAGIEKPCIIRCSSPSQNSGTNLTSKPPSLYSYRPITPVSTNLQKEESRITSDFKGAIHEASLIAPVKSGRASITNIRDSHSYRNPSRSSGLRSSCNSSISPSPICHSVSSKSPVSIQSVSLSKIMTVVNVEPDCEQFNDLTLTINQRSSQSAPDKTIATPIDYTSSDSENLDTVPINNFRKQRSMHCIRNKDSYVNIHRATRRRENSMKEDLSMKERNLNLRLSKIERENAILLAALDGIVRRFSASGTETSSVRIKGEEGNNELRRATKSNTTLCHQEDEEEHLSRRIEEEKRAIFNRVKY